MECVYHPSSPSYSSNIQREKQKYMFIKRQIYKIYFLYMQQKSRKRKYDKMRKKRKTVRKKRYKDYGDGIIYLIFDGHNKVFKYVGKK